jgi:hypothetical protein
MEPLFLHGQGALWSAALLGQSFLINSLDAIKEKLKGLHNHWANKPVASADDLPEFHIHVPGWGKSKVGAATRKCPGTCRAGFLTPML